MFGSTVLNYMDRQTITLVESQVREAFAIPDFAGFGWVIAAFSMTYALFQVPAGFLVDRWNLRWTYAAAVAWWSLAAMATAVVPTLGWLFVCRALLGVGESFNWPCALRVTASILPPKDRSLGNGIFNSGAAVGAVLTPIVVTYLRPRLGWRTTFQVIGALGFVWVAAWMLLVRGQPSRMLLSTQDTTNDEIRGGEPTTQSLSLRAKFAFAAIGLASIGSACLAVRFGPAAIWVGIALLMLGTLAVAACLPRRDLGDSTWATSLHDVARLKKFWILVVVSIAINIPWHFLVTWLPSFFKNDRHLGQSAAGYLTAATFLAADAGNLGGGFSSRWLAGKGIPVARARITVMALCILLILAGPALAMARSDAVVVILIAVMATGTAAFMANYFSFTQEVSSRHTGLVAGYLGGLGNLFVAAYSPFAGALRDWTKSFTMNFLIVGLAPIVGITVLVLGWGQPETTEKARLPELDDF
jgi:ACS family hexuronate transporter-like MFS transporter